MCLRKVSFLFNDVYLVFVFRIRGQAVHMLVDTSHPLSRGTLLHDIFESHQDRPDQKALQRLMIRSILTLSS